MAGFVYLIGQLDNKEMFKIGVTKKDVNLRLKELQTGSSEELYVCSHFFSKFSHKLEKMLHRHFSSNNKINEWFTLDESQYTNFQQICEKYENILNSLQDNPFFNKKSVRLF